MERKGITIGVNDLHIAGHARREGLMLVSNNLREFDRVDGLLLDNPGMNTYKRHRFPPDIISYVVWLYCGFNLSHRGIEDRLGERGMMRFKSVRLDSSDLRKLTGQNPTQSSMSARCFCQASISESWASSKLKPTSQNSSSSAEGMHHRTSPTK